MRKEPGKEAYGGMGIAVAARERAAIALLQLQEIQQRFLLRAKRCLGRAICHAIGNGFLFGALWVGLELQSGELAIMWAAARRSATGWVRSSARTMACRCSAI
jgi:hypothetical protein